MLIDRYSKVVLTFIVIALGVIAVRPILAASVSLAAKPIEYKVLASRGEPSDALLNEQGQAGWELIWFAPGVRYVFKR
jgi:hypothetical protein